MATEQRMARTTTDIMDTEAAVPKHKLTVGANKTMERHVDASASYFQKSVIDGGNECSVYRPRPSEPAKASATAQTSQLAAVASAARLADSHTVIRQSSVSAHLSTPTAAAPQSERSLSTRVASSTRQCPPPAADPRAAQLVSILNQAQREERLRSRKAVQGECGVRTRAQSQNSVDGGGAVKPSTGPIPRPALRAVPHASPPGHKTISIYAHETEYAPAPAQSSPQGQRSQSGNPSGTGRSDSPSRPMPGDSVRGRSLSASHQPTAATWNSQEGSPRGANGEAQRRGASGEAQRGGIPNMGASAATRGWVPGGKAVGRSASVGRVVSRRMREDGASGGPSATLCTARPVHTATMRHEDGGASAAAPSSASVAGHVKHFHPATTSSVRPNDGSGKVGGMIPGDELFDIKVLYVAPRGEYPS